LGIAGAGLTGATAGGIAAGTVATTAVGATTGASVVLGGATIPAMTTMTAMGPIGWIDVGLLGADTDGLSWDCWKPVLHDKSTAPSSGMPMKEHTCKKRVMWRRRLFWPKKNCGKSA